MTTVAEILKTKPDAQIYSVAPSDSVLAALQLMADKGIGALLVLQDGAIVGIFTERDYARKVVLHGRASGDTPVREVMTHAVRFVRPGQSSEQCMALMTEKRVRHVPVMDGPSVLGVVSIGDMVKVLVAERESVIHGLENYIVAREFPT